MELELLRYASGLNDTLGLFFIDCTWYCYTLEDQYQSVKVKHETRIPSGVYKIKFRKEGGFHNRYKHKFDSHKGMLQLEGVPGFEFILIHVGNSKSNTSGCILLGSTANSNTNGKTGFIGDSTGAYKQVYPVIAEALERGEEVNLTIKDLQS